MDEIITYSLSFKGRRESNEDNSIVISPSEDSLFIAVADGMGGVTSGEVASKLVIECCNETLNEFFKNDVKPGQLKEILNRIFFQAQLSIRNKVKENPQLNGMGSTLNCALILNDLFVWGNIGDSRLYHYVGKELKLISKDHTHIQDFIDNNSEKLSQNLIDNYSNYLTRSIDGGQDEPDIFPDVEPYLKMNDGEALLICSDGLILNKADDSSKLFKKYLIGTKNIEEAGNKLVKMAFEKGSTDNITVVMLEKGKIKRKKIDFYENGLLKPQKINNKSDTFKIIYSKITRVLAGLSFVILLLIVLIVYNEHQNTIPDVELMNNISERNEFSHNQAESEIPLTTDPTLLNQNNEQYSNEFEDKEFDEMRIEVPNLVGLTEKEAVKKIKKLELEYIIEPQPILGKNEGKVLFQDPKPTSEVIKGSVIKLAVSTTKIDKKN